jgi:hypothetical protein
MSFINPNIKKILLLDIALFFIGLTGIYQLVERAGFNTNSDLDLLLNNDHKLIIEKIINTKFESVFIAGDILRSVDSHHISSIDQLEVVTDSHKINSQLDMEISRNQIDEIETISGVMIDGEMRRPEASGDFPFLPWIGFVYNF